MNMTPDLASTGSHAERFAAFRTALEQRMLRHVGAPAGAPSRLMAASTDAILASGKRMRPFLVHLAGDGADDAALLDAGCALEMVHSASLILDDLPCMDDSGLRRGRPATHVAWGQATAILGAVGLLNQSFAILGTLSATDAQRVALVTALSGAVGWGGLVAGQEYDVNGFGAGDGPSSILQRIDQVNRMKTGVLLVAAVEMGAILAGQDDTRRGHLRQFATDLGQAFQIADDLGDSMKTAEEFGKDVGKDANKTTFVAELGPERALRRCLDLLLRAQHALDAAGVDPAPYQWMIGEVFDRDLLVARMATRREERVSS
ncbi:polyprenyl synthetase family protein [Falsirhodobacter sp. 20TX0035]|uniref:polyprenyl synthetase family protein n=1 Tax=Falsirhodobacter sp. 20TX0035 TaxID=3022019 RepID=UPI0023309C6F|nr:polyprenyl synthetase family protein [Falsirhodobacter sp. 20TX0035]MDB6452039.1 polyprenyl synthetase family protein [Falsirhodobacter sp. 20TX0035]